ncbi:hypothetical protein GCM10010254_14260 [Streptomyces chromofuscus]|nr:hypothetical protein GCM10010254_14260 [Streptomyces chromofuscus]
MPWAPHSVRRRRRHSGAGAALKEGVVRTGALHLDARNHACSTAGMAASVRAEDSYAARRTATQAAGPIADLPAWFVLSCTPSRAGRLVPSVVIARITLTVGRFPIA